MKKNLLFAAIILLGFILRSFFVSNVPPGLNRDEAALGYTAFSILKTGRDEYGKFLPISLESFGDWKLPLYSYITILPLTVFSLSEFSVRVVSVIAGTLSVALLFFVIIHIFFEFQYKNKLALLSIFFFAVSPWSIHFSRVASEANLAVCFILFGTLLFFKGLEKTKYLVLSSIFLALTLLTYHGNHVFTPLFFLGLCVLLWKKLKPKRNYILFVVPIIGISIFVFSQTLFSANKTKLAGLTPLSDAYLVYERVTQPRNNYPISGSIESKLFDNKVGFLLGRFLDGYIRSFSPEFLFIQGGTNLQHNIPFFGNLYMAESVFILLGLFFLFHKKFPSRYILLYWLLISPLGAAITKDSPHSARMLAVLPLPHILTALGVVFMILSLRQKWLKQLSYLGIAFIFTLNISLYFSRYFINFPKAREANWGGGYKELVTTVLPLLSQYKEVRMDKPADSPYIYFLFYGKIDPTYLQTHTVRYDPDKEGFHHVKEIGNLYFDSFNGTDELFVPNRLLISWADATLPNATHSAVIHTPKTISEVKTRYGKDYGLKVGDEVVSKLLETIYLKNGEKQFFLIGTFLMPQTIVKNEK